MSKEQKKGDLSDVAEWIYSVDVNAIADPLDKIAECQYFLDLASNELNVQRFRWQISAFLGASYSFFEISACSAYIAITDPQTGESVRNADAIETLEHYVTVNQNPKKGNRVDTGAIHKETQAAIHEVTKQLYELRTENTHHYPLSIMNKGTGLPEAFHFGHDVRNNSPALAFCRSVMSLIQQVQKELDA